MRKQVVHGRSGWRNDRQGEGRQVPTAPTPSFGRELRSTHSKRELRSTHSTTVSTLTPSTLPSTGLLGSGGVAWAPALTPTSSGGESPPANTAVPSCSASASARARSFVRARRICHTTLGEDLSCSKSITTLHTSPPPTLSHTTTVSDRLPLRKLSLPPTHMS
jgi:hypothetical protein